MFINDQIDLTHSELFKSFDEIEGDGFDVDLHNEFKCDSINFKNQKTELILSFMIEPKFARKVNRIDIVFEDVRLESFFLKKDNESPDEWTINNIYRGRFQKEEDVLELSNDGRSYYYIDFYQDYSFELFARDVTAKVFLND